MVADVQRQRLLLDKHFGVGVCNSGRVGLLVGGWDVLGEWLGVMVCGGSGGGV